MWATGKVRVIGELGSSSVGLRSQTEGVVLSLRIIGSH